MARFKVEVEVSSRGLAVDVEHGIREILSDHNYNPQNLQVKTMPEPTRLADFPSQNVRRRIGDETYRVVIPGLFKEGREVTVPIWETDVDLELLDHYLNGG
jgi:hypothetical protein